MARRLTEREKAFRAKVRAAKAERDAVLVARFVRKANGRLGRIGKRALRELFERAESIRYSSDPIGMRQPNDCADAWKRWYADAEPSARAEMARRRRDTFFHYGPMSGVFERDRPFEACAICRERASAWTLRGHRFCRDCQEALHAAELAHPAFRAICGVAITLGMPHAFPRDLFLHDRSHFERDAASLERFVWCIGSTGTTFAWFSGSRSLSTMSAKSAGHWLAHLSEERPHAYYWNGHALRPVRLDEPEALIALCTGRAIELPEPSAACA